METPNWLDDFATKRVQAAFHARFDGKSGEFFKELTERHQRTDFTVDHQQDLMARKNHEGIGSFRPADRSTALDLMGVATQLVFPTSTNVWMELLEHGDDLDILYETASATNRSQVEFCSHDERLLPVGYVPLAHLDRAKTAAKEALELGVQALLIPWACPKNHATSHVELDHIWAQAVEAKVPVLFHVGVADKVLPVAHKNNGLPPVPDFMVGRKTSGQFPIWQFRTALCRLYRC